jgi:hypothetical protein
MIEGFELFVCLDILKVDDAEFDPISNPLCSKTTS